MKQIITVKSDECHEVEIREVMRGYIFQGIFYLLTLPEEMTFKGDLRIEKN